MCSTITQRLHCQQLTRFSELRQLQIQQPWLRVRTALGTTALEIDQQASEALITLASSSLQLGWPLPKLRKLGSVLGAKLPLHVTKLGLPAECAQLLENLQSSQLSHAARPGCRSELRGAAAASSAKAVLMHSLTVRKLHQRPRSTVMSMEPDCLKQNVAPPFQRL